MSEASKTSETPATWHLPPSPLDKQHHQLSTTQANGSSMTQSEVRARFPQRRRAKAASKWHKVALVAVALSGQVNVAQAQVASALNLTTSCQSAAASLLSTPFAACSNLLGLAKTFAAQNSIIPGLNDWLGQACPTTCSETEISQSTQTLAQGCSQDIQNGSILAQALLSLVGDYSTFQDFVCLESVSNGSYCIIDTLQAIENATSTISASALSQIVVTGANSLFPLLGAIGPSVICTDCVHGLITQLSPILGPANVALAGQALNSTCGPGFVDGKMPASVRLAHSESPAASPSGNGSTGATGTVSSGGAGSTGQPTSAARRTMDLSLWLTVATAAVTMVAWSLL